MEAVSFYDVMRRQQAERPRDRTGAVSLAFFIAILVALLTAIPEAALGALATTPITGTAHGAGRTGQGDTDLYVPSVTDFITQIDVSSFPFTTLLDTMPGASMPGDELKQPKHSWPEVSRFERQDLIDGLTTAGAAGAAKTITVDGSVAWHVGMVLYAPDNATDDGPYLVTVVTSSTSINIVKLNASGGATPWTTEAFGTVPVFADNEKLYWINTSKTEADSFSASMIIQPAEKFNFIETFDAYVEISDHMRRSRQYGGDAWQRYRDNRLFEFRKDQEYGSIFKENPSITLDPNNSEKRWTMGGLKHFVTTTATLSHTSNVPTTKNLNAFIYDCFNNQNGGRVKTLMAGTEFMETLDNGAQSELHRGREETIGGVTLMELKSRKGTLMTVHHPGYDEMGIGDEGHVIDFGFIRKLVWQEPEMNEVNLKTTGSGKDADAEHYITKWTLVVANAGTHRRVVLQ